MSHALYMSHATNQLLATTQELGKQRMSMASLQIKSDLAIKIFHAEINCGSDLFGFQNCR